MTENLDTLAERLIDLETRLAFQDRTIEELHQALYSQQTQLDQLTQEVARVKGLAEGASGNGHG
jgi:uncharacterized coiled-coil protein SlyX